MSGPNAVGCQRCYEIAVAQSLVVVVVLVVVIQQGAHVYGLDAGDSHTVQIQVEVLVVHCLYDVRAVYRVQSAEFGF